jgi:hypothetical protein
MKPHMNIGKGHDYLKRKTSEIECLKRYAPEDKPESAPRTHQEVIDQKQRLKTAIRRANINPLWGMSNLTGEKTIECHGFRIKYTYQRSGFNIENKNHLELIYQNLNLPRDHSSHAFWTHCGQAAISLLFNTLANYKDKFCFQTFPKDIYFETTLFLDDNDIFDIKGQTNKILFIDSSTLEKGDWDDLKLGEGLALIIFDTTAYPLSSPRILRVLNIALDHNVPCVLVRSHLKLDSLGMEYSRLGSMCLVYGNQNELCIFLLEKYPNALRFMGGYASPEQLYPFYLDSEYQRKNNIRLSIVNESNRQFYRYLSQKDLYQGAKLPGLRGFDHELFCLISIQPNMDWDSFIDQLVLWTRVINDSGQPCRLTESFGWDFISLSAFMHDDDRSNARLAEKIWDLRVAIPDIAAPELIAFADKLTNFVKEL